MEEMIKALIEEGYTITVKPHYYRHGEDDSPMVGYHVTTELNGRQLGTGKQGLLIDAVSDAYQETPANML